MKKQKRRLIIAYIIHAIGAFLCLSWYFIGYYGYGFTELAMLGFIAAAMSAVYIFSKELRKNEDGKTHLYVVDKWHIELYFIVLVAIAIAGLFCLAVIGYMRSRYQLALLGVEVYYIGMLLLLSLLRRRRAKMRFRDAFILVQLVAVTRQFVTSKCLPKIKTYLLLAWIGGNLLVALLAFGALGSADLAWIMLTMFVWAIVVCDLILAYQIMQNCVWRKQIIDGVECIVNGELSYEIDCAQMDGEAKVLAEGINHMSDGLEQAIDKAVRNERMKTELITNVSHDIKTPLTSIINYVDLIQRENVDNEKIKSYVEVLVKKSQRLKHLTEDLVEASKVSTGNIEIERVRLDFIQLIEQGLGEIEDRFNERNLVLVSAIAEEPVTIFADGRRVYRILDNLLTNVYKYAMPGTRVYVETILTDHTVSMTIKNISEHQLNIPTEELTERFIRGDVSRSTEGSGLGLSIAKSLTELMNGTFELYLEGDLFKATVTFNRIA